MDCEQQKFVRKVHERLKREYGGRLGETHDHNEVKEIEPRKPGDDFQEHITTEGFERGRHLVAEG